MMRDGTPSHQQLPHAKSAGDRPTDSNPLDIVVILCRSPAAALLASALSGSTSCWKARPPPPAAVYRCTAPPDE